MPSYVALRAPVYTVLVGSAGSILEWYDFALFGFLAPEIGELFFPAHDPAASLMEAFAVFAGAFFFRPIGGLLFGYIGDRWSRKTAMLLSIAMMAVATCSMGLLPTYESAGIAAPLLLVAVRLLQGMSVGGQLVGAFVLLVETAPPERRSMYGAICLAGAVTGTTLGSIVATVLRESMDRESLMAWGWRVPFLCGLAVGLVTVAVKHKVPESASQTALKQQHGESTSPIRDALRATWRHVLVIWAGCALWCNGVYTYSVWIASYESTIAEPPMPHAFAVNSVMLVLLIFSMVAMGRIADRFGGARVMVCGSTLGVAVGVPAFLLFGKAEVGATVLGQAVLMVCISAFGGPMGTWMVSMCPPATRYTTLALGYNAGQALLGGTAPLIATGLVRATQGLVAPGIYFCCVAALSTVAVTFGRRWLEMYDATSGTGTRVVASSSHRSHAARAAAV